jgi:hypothetical protein
MRLCMKAMQAPALMTDDTAAGTSPMLEHQQYLPERGWNLLATRRSKLKVTAREMSMQTAACIQWVQTTCTRCRFHRPSLSTALPVLLAFLAATSTAGVPSAKDCVEAGDFIGNAALARDRGITEEQFLARIHEDLEVIKAFPPQLRWFVQDDEDAQFLIEAATAVFREPKAAADHRADIIGACMARSRGNSGTTPPPPGPSI